MPIQEVQPHYSPDTFAMSRYRIGGVYTVNLLEAEKPEVGQLIRREIGTLVSAIDKSVLPESLFIADDIPVKVSDRLTRITELRYEPNANRLYRASRLRSIGQELAESNGEVIEPTIWTTTEMLDEEWVKYGLGVVNKLENAVEESQAANNQQ